MMPLYFPAFAPVLVEIHLPVMELFGCGQFQHQAWTRTKGRRHPHHPPRHHLQAPIKHLFLPPIQLPNPHTAKHLALDAVWSVQQVKIRRWTSPGDRNSSRNFCGCRSSETRWTQFLCFLVINVFILDRKQKLLRALPAGWRCSAALLMPSAATNESSRSGCVL